MIELRATAENQCEATDHLHDTARAAWVASDGYCDTLWYAIKHDCLYRRLLERDRRQISVNLARGPKRWRVLVAVWKLSGSEGWVPESPPSQLYEEHWIDAQNAADKAVSEIRKQQ